MTCDHHLLDDPAGLRCTRPPHDDRGHTYTASWLGDAHDAPLRDLEAL